MDKQLKKIAVASRREMERFVRHKGDTFNTGDLACYCAIASYFFIMLGRKFGYKMTLVEGIAFDDDVDAMQNGEKPAFGVNHFWVEYEGKIIDLTATQFDSDLKKVHVVDVDDENYWAMSRNNAARRHLQSIWPKEQTPYLHIVELRKRAKILKTKLAA